MRGLYIAGVLLSTIYSERLCLRDGEVSALARQSATRESRAELTPPSLPDARYRSTAGALLGRFGFHEVLPQLKDAALVEVVDLVAQGKAEGEGREGQQAGQRSRTGEAMR